MHKPVEYQNNPVCAAFNSASHLLQLVEGATLLLGAAGCLLVSLGPLWLRAPSLGLALLLGLMLSGMEGFLTGELELHCCGLLRRSTQHVAHTMLK